MNINYMYFSYFVIYSFLGWICETTYCFIIDKQYVNRGFLNGPFCPIYGVGALIVIIMLTPVSYNIILIFLSAMIFTSILEYITGFLLEVIFNLKWWDYSNYRFNIKGRVCLLNSTLFGILSVVTFKVINPVITELLNNIQSNIIIWICNILIIVFLYDTIITVYKVLQLGGKLEEMHVLFEELREKSEIYKDIVQQKMKWESVIVKNKSVNKRIINAFPNIKSLKYESSLERLKEEIRKRKKK